jgi:hypothetical protein
MIGTNGLIGSLGYPRSAVDQRRTRLFTGAVTGCGVMLLAVAALITIPGPTVVFDENMGFGYIPAPEVRDLAGYVAETGMRRGAMFAALLLVVPFALFGLQALRTGTAARERRLALLSLAGATRPQLRRLSFLEGSRSAVIGGLLAGPGYLLLWLVLGYLLPEGARMLPRPSLALLLSWPALVVGLGIAGGWAAALVARPASVSPLGIARRQPRPLGSGQALLAGGCLLLIAIELPLIKRNDYPFAGPVLFTLIAVMAMSGAPWLIQVVGRRAVRRDRDLITAMAGRRLLADVRSPGRVAAVLFAVGLVLGIFAAEFRDIVQDNATPAFALWGLAAITIGGLIAGAMASFSLLVGVAEQVLDGRRATAALVALAASDDFVSRVVRRQLLLAAVPAAVTGALVGWCVDTAMASGHWIFPPVDLFLLSLPIAVLIAGLAAGAGALVASHAVRPVIRESSTPDNLRVA